VLLRVNSWIVCFLEPAAIHEFTRIDTNTPYLGSLETSQMKDAPLSPDLKQEAPKEQDAQDDEDGYDDDFYETHNRHLGNSLDGSDSKVAS
jgi:hypothetical protein